MASRVLFFLAILVCILLCLFVTTPGAEETSSGSSDDSSSSNSTSSDDSSTSTGDSGTSNSTSSDDSSTTSNSTTSDDSSTSNSTNTTSSDYSESSNSSTSGSSSNDTTTSSSDSSESSNTTASTTIVFAQVAFRNGLHAVETDDPYNISYHEEDVTDLRLKADLTKRGKNQEYMVGKYLKERYANLFNNSYDQYKIRMFSGYKNRSMSSAALVLAGMFPPQQDYEIWNEDLPWQPIPIHINTKITDTDSMNIALFGSCKNLNWIKTDEAYTKLKEHYSWIIDFLCEMTNQSSSAVSAMSISSALVNLKEYPGSEPDWANETVMEAARDYYWDIHAMVNSYHGIVRLSGGWILEDIINEMKYYTSHGSSRKFVGYSLHVDNQNSLLISLNNESYPKQWPPMGGFMAIELHSIDSQYIVKAYYWYKSYSDPIQVNITDCDDPCTLEKFEARSRDYHVDNWGVECGQLENSNSTASEDSSETTTVSSSESSSSNDTSSDESSSTDNSTAVCSSTSSEEYSPNTTLFVLCIVFGVLFLITLVALLRAKRTNQHRNEYFEIK